MHVRNLAKKKQKKGAKPFTFQHEESMWNWYRFDEGLNTLDQQNDYHVQKGHLANFSQG